jgi:hypothetical protein
VADNIRVVPSANGADPLVATDDIAGVQYQKVKFGWGADGVWNETTDTDGIRVPVGGAQLGAVNETAPASDIANSGLNGRLQRIAQRLTSLIALLPAALGASGGLKVDGSGTALPVSGTFWQATQPVSGTVTANAGTNTSTAALGAATATDPGGTTTSLQVVGATTSLRLVGFSARETTGTAGSVFNVRHGTSNAGALLATVSLGANESAREWFGPDGIAAASGIWLERVSGSTTFVGYSKVAA